MIPVKADRLHVALLMVFLDSTGVWLSCLAKNYTSALALLSLVFANPVTFCFSQHSSTAAETISFLNTDCAVLNSYYNATKIIITL